MTGVQTCALPIYSAESSSIYVYNNDVYVAGREFDGPLSIATYWKNGEPIALSKGSPPTPPPLIHDNVFVAGDGEHSNGYPVAAKYWKNGTSVDLSDGQSLAAAQNIFVVKK